MTTALLLLTALLLAYANGSNDNVKGVATLIGANRLSQKGAVLWAAVTTFAGSIASAWLARGLVAMFSGRGLVPDALASTPHLCSSVGLAAVGTVALATWLGFPISTTHALVGGLIGAGLVAAPGDLHWAPVARLVALPLATSPLVALVASAALVTLVRFLSRKQAGGAEPCVCILPSPVLVAPPVTFGCPGVSVVSGSVESCGSLPQGVLGMMTPSRALDGLHFLSSAAVSFARGLNDTPKIAALSLVAMGTPSSLAGVWAVALAMAAGGLLHGVRVARTMARDITPMTVGQAAVANGVTAALCLAASLFALPVSTTHVSCGALFGLGVGRREGRGATIGKILLAWLITLPMGAVLAAALFTIQR